MLKKEEFFFPGTRSLPHHHKKANFILWEAIFFFRRAEVKIQIVFFFRQQSLREANKCNPYHRIWYVTGVSEFATIKRSCYKLTKPPPYIYDIKANRSNNLFLLD